MLFCLVRDHFTPLVLINPHKFQFLVLNYFSLNFIFKPMTPIILNQTLINQCFHCNFSQLFGFHHFQDYIHNSIPPIADGCCTEWPTRRSNYVLCWLLLYCQARGFLRRSSSLARQCGSWDSLLRRSLFIQEQQPPALEAATAEPRYRTVPAADPTTSYSTCVCARGHLQQAAVSLIRDCSIVCEHVNVLLHVKYCYRICI